MSCGVGHRRSLDLALLWLWLRLAATALTGPPSLGTSTCQLCSPEKIKDKKKKKKGIVGYHLFSLKSYTNSDAHIYIYVNISGEI